MLVLDGSVESLRKDQTHRFAKCYLLERVDGTTFCFTDHNREIEYDGNTYTPVGGMSVSAEQKLEKLGPSNQEVVGILSDAAITHEDLMKGLYQEAKITIYILDYMYPWAGAFNTMVFWITNTEFTGEFWKATIEGLGRWLAYPKGFTYTRTCRHTLGDVQCGVDTSALKALKTITQVDNIRRVFRTTGLAQANDYFTNGLVIWTSGNNDGYSCEVKDFSTANDIIELHLNTPYDIEVGDGFDIYPGCDKTFATCKDKFSNGDNFGGFPFIPGTDRVISSGRQK
jgi:uncharacterized phage protein (TIGR02218 family)